MSTNEATPPESFKEQSTWHNKTVKIELLNKHVAQPEEWELDTQNDQKNH